MVRAVWITNELVISRVTEKEALALPQWVRDTLASEMVAVCNGIAYAATEEVARRLLE